jgi:pimeloyl-ACP methyl ester carboxylesterase
MAVESSAASSVAPEREGFVEVNGLRLHWAEWNPEGGRAALLVHGAKVQLHTWDPIAAHLAADRWVVAVDLRGHGDSQWAPDGYAIGSFVSDLRGMVDRLALAPCDYVGHSLGARIGIAFAAEHGGLVRRLVLSDTGPELPAEAARYNQALLGDSDKIKGFRSADEALEHYRGLHPEWQPIFHQLHVEHQLRENWAGKLVFKADPDLFWLAGSAGRRETPYVWESVGRITAPTLVVWGRRSRFLDDAMVERMTALLARVEVARPDTGHYVPREDPAAFVRLVTDFLDA